MTMPSFCRSCGNRLGDMDRVYCSAAPCQEKARSEVVSARFRAISSELEEEDVSAMPKERLLALLGKDCEKYSEGPAADLGYMTDFVLLTEKVKKHPWDDCAKFLVERNVILEKIRNAVLEKIEGAKVRPHPGSQSGSVAVPYVDPYVKGFADVADDNRLFGRSLKDRVIKKEDVENGYYTPLAQGFGFGPDFGTPDFRDLLREDERRFYRQDLSGRTETPRYDAELSRPPPAQSRSFGDDVFLRFGPVNVGAGMSIAWNIMPQVPFRCTRLLIDSVTASDFEINDLRIGRDSIMSANPIPATAFTERAIGIAFCLDVVIGLPLSLFVRNTSREMRVFSAALCGTKP